MTTENDLQTEIRLALGKRTDVVMFRNNTGVAESGGRYIKYGLGKGSPDLVGLVRPSGRMVALEIKLPGKKPSGDQVKFLRLLNLGGAVGRVVTSVEQANEVIDYAIETAGAWTGKTYSLADYGLTDPDPCYRY